MLRFVTDTSASLSRYLLIIMIRTINSYLCMSMCNNPMPYASMPYAQFLCLPFMDFPLFIALVTYPLP